VVVVAAAAAAVEREFERFWQAYPKRDGASMKSPSREKFAAALKSGQTAADLIACAERYRAECERRSIVGTQFVASARTWLTQRRWEDDAPTLPNGRGKPPMLPAPFPCGPTGTVDGSPAPQPGTIPETRLGRPNGFAIDNWNDFGQHWTPKTPGGLPAPQWEAWKRDHWKPERTDGQA